jgi:ParB/RepB/Spo0J family partition protein
MADTENRAVQREDVRQLPTDALHPNDYNPNRMTGEEFTELVEEVRHLGRLPKPVVVRNGYAADEYLIVDGEHGWRAAKEVGLAEVTCEVIKADDFEAMRQTYKRNQHGTHDRVALGEMFKRMAKERCISNRELAKDINVSEGTIRNALMFAEAAESRRRFSPEKGATKDDYYFSTMTTKQARDYMYLPEGLRDRWLNAGAPPVGNPETWGFGERDELGHEYFEDLAKSGIAKVFERGGWENNARLSCELMMWRSEHSRVLGDRRDEYIKPVIELHPRNPTHTQILNKLPIANGKPLLTPEQWAEAIRVAWEKSDKVMGVLSRLGAVAKLKAREEGIPEDDLDDPRVALLKVRVEKDAPAFIRDANIPLRDKGFLLNRADHYYDGRAGVSASSLSDEERLKCKHMAVDHLVKEHERYRREQASYETESRNFAQLLDPMPPEQQVKAIMSGAGPKRPRFPVHAEKAWVAAIKTNQKAAEQAEKVAQVAELKKTFEDPDKVREAIIERLGSVAPKTLGQEVGGKAVRVVLRERLKSVPEPEMLLLGAVMLKAPVSVWLEAVRKEVEREVAREA